MRRGLKGDGGRACGIAQQHARFSVGWPTSKAKGSRRRECQLLMDDEYALTVLLYRLGRIKARYKNLDQKFYVYNSRWDVRGWRYHGHHMSWRHWLDTYYKEEVAYVNSEDQGPLL